MNIEDFGPFTLSPLSHASPADGMCVMEMVSFLAGEKWSEYPACASPIVSQYCQVVNDNITQAGRDKLQRYVPRLIGTESPEHEKDRAEYLAWAAIKILAPIAIDAVGFPEQAHTLRNFKEAAILLDFIMEQTKDEQYTGAYKIIYAAHIITQINKYTISSFQTQAMIVAQYTLNYFSDAEEVLFEVLDGLLEIGPSGKAYTEQQLSRVAPLREAIKQPA